MSGLLEVVVAGAMSEEIERLGTPEEIAAARAEYERLVAAGVPWASTERRRAHMRWVRLQLPKERKRVARAERERRARLVEAGQRTERATAKLVGLLDAVDARPLVVRLLQLARTDLVDALARRLRARPCEACGQTGKEAMKAEQQLLDLVNRVFTVERQKDPPKKGEARPVLVREWPSEGVKG